MKKAKRLVSISIIALMAVTFPFAGDAALRVSFAAEGSDTTAETPEDRADSASEEQDAVQEETETSSETYGAPDEAGDPDGISEETDRGSEEEMPDEDPAVPGTMTEVTVVDSAIELSKESSAADNDPFFTLDVSKKKPAEELATEEITGDVTGILSGGAGASDKKDAVIETLEDSGFYTAEEGAGTKVEVTSQFAYQRLRLVTGYKDEIEAYGAETAVFYKDHYLLTYGSEAATKLAYDALVKEYGESSVFIDLPLRADSTAQGWGTEYMGLDSEMAEAAGGADVIVAVCDSGICYDHDVFSGKTVLEGCDVIAGTEGAEDDCGHGTEVAGIIAESTPSNVSILPIKVLGEDGDGSLEDVLTGVAIADELGAAVVNLSLGGNIKSSYFAYYEEKFSGFDTLCVCSSGNEGMDLDEDGVNYFPGEMESVLCVGAFDKNGDICSSFSNHGSALDFAAPGKSVRVANYSYHSTYSADTGTSFACPYVSAAAALMKAEHPDAGSEDLVRALECASVDMGEEGWDEYFGNGCPKFPVDIASLFSLSKSSYTYNGSVRTPAVKAEFCGTELTEGTDYTVTYQSGRKNVGAYSVEITGTGKYTGTKALSFRIVPKGTSISKLYKAKKAITVRWKKQTAKMSSSRITGYQIQAATNSDFTKNKKTVTVSGYKRVSKRITGLKSKKKYYVRVRTYKTIDGTRYYSSWSKVKSIRTR